MPLLDNTEEDRVTFKPEFLALSFIMAGSEF